MKRVDLIITYLAKLQRENDISLVLGGDQGVQLIGTVNTFYAQQIDYWCNSSHGVEYW